MRYAPHILKKKSVEVTRNSYNEVIDTKVSWEEMGVVVVTIISQSISKLIMAVSIHLSIILFVTDATFLKETRLDALIVMVVIGAEERFSIPQNVIILTI